MKGSSPASAIMEIKRTTEILYHLKSSVGIEGQEAHEWIDGKLPSGQSPFEIIASRQFGNWGYSSMRDKKDPLIEELERLGIGAFSWTRRLQSR
jgi:hypothetical protein